MAKSKVQRILRPATQKTAATNTIKAELERKAQELVEKVLIPRYVRPPQVNARFNYITHIEAKWHGSYFYFIATYACPGPNALSPSFEWKFARLEHRGDDKFALYAMRHTGNEWFGLWDDQSVHDCLKSIENDPWFQI